MVDNIKIAVKEWDNYYKLRRLQNKAWQGFVTKCVKYYKVCQVLQSASGITKCDRLFLQRASGIAKFIFYFLICIYFKCSKLKHSKFNLISFFIFISKHKALHEQNFLEHFSNKDLKTLHRQLYCRFSWAGNWKLVLWGQNFEEAMFVYVLKRKNVYLLQVLSQLASG